MDELTTLLQAATRGDRAALAAFVRRTQAEVWRFVAHLVDPASADDLTQEVFLRALAAAPRFRGEASARTWLLSIARRTAADEIRRRQRRRRLPDRPPRDEVDPAGQLALTDLLTALRPERREAFVLTQVLGLSYAEAAEACQVPVGTIRSRVSRARGDLLAMLDDEAPALTERRTHAGH